MIIHENTLISDELLQNAFVCDLNSCKGACCIEGDSGAPLLEEEIAIIEKHLEAVKPYMDPQLLKQVEREGFYEKDDDGDLVTRCRNGRECVFATTENGVYKCAIEKAYEAGTIDFKKPVSCHLYPVRISDFGEYTALNYSRWDICSAACKLGASLQVPVYKFLKDALVRRFGEDWYNGLEELAEVYNQQQSGRK